jgi:ribosomal 50S subunit-recycling heat shock protein
MKKVWIMALTVLIGFAFVTGAFAQAPAGTPEQKTTTTTTTTTTISKSMTFRGKVTNLDTAASMMTVEGKKGEMTFDVSNAKMKGEVKVGDMVRVKYTEKDGKMMASWVTKHHGAKKTKTTTTTTETKEETTTPAK